MPEQTNTTGSLSPETKQARARLDFCAAAINAPAHILAATTQIRKAVAAAKVFEEQFRDADAAMFADCFSDDQAKERVFGDRYPALVQAADQLAALTVEVFALGQVLGRLVAESEFLPDDGPETWLRDHGCPALSDSLEPVREVA